MKNGISLVTAFYDIKRGSWQGGKRSNLEYFDYFSKWAGVKNELIIYTSSDLYDQVSLIAKACRPNLVTKIVKKDLEKINVNLYSLFENGFKKYSQSEFRKFPNNPECLYFKYCYLNCCKPFFVLDSIKNKLINEENSAWIDFGFNHGDSYFLSKLDCLLVDKYSLLDSKKIVLFKIKDDTFESMAKIYFDMSVIYIGPMILATNNKWHEFSSDMEVSIKAASQLGIFDDDQFYMVMAVRNNKNNYHLVPSNRWFDILENFIPDGYEFETKRKKKNYFCRLRDLFYKK